MKQFMTLIAAAALVTLAACGPKGPGPSGQAKGTQLTAEEVRFNFVGVPWRGPSGTYLFLANGTYTYESEKTTIKRGPSPFSITDDGLLQTKDTTLTFYKIGNAFRYHSTATDEFYVALPIK